MSKALFQTERKEEQTPWPSISDMMSGLMMIFLFISIAYMNSVTKEKERVEQVAITWNQIQDELFRDLEREFKNDLPKWRASLDRETLSVRFEEPSVFFQQGSATLTPGFQAILSDFFPRYVKVLRKFQQNIAEVRIEGHTSSEWYEAASRLEAYIHNMELSQNRTRSVLEYCLTIPSMKQHQDWAISTITANGLSSSNLKKNIYGQEDPILSRRVEFRVRTDAEKRIMTIFESTQ